jgi:RNA polymerase sigma-70 factor (ECF subfamily)
MSPSIDDFDAVLAGAQAGEEWAFAVLYDAIQPGLLRYLRWQEPRCAEDLASETWLGFAQGLHSFDGGEGALRAWMFTIARHRLANHRRSEGRRRTSPVPGDAFTDIAVDEDPADLVAARMSAQTAIAHLSSVLSPDQAEVIVLRVVGGLSVDEVATVLGKRSGTVRVLQHRALRRLSSQVNALFSLEV